MSATHTHAGPGPLLGGMNPPEEEERLQRYYDFLELRISDAVKLCWKNWIVGYQKYKICNGETPLRILV